MMTFHKKSFMGASITQERAVQAGEIFHIETLAGRVTHILVEIPFEPL